MRFSTRLQLLRELAPAWLAALWWGSLSTIGFLVVPMLFVYLPTPAMAGSMAAKLFTAQTWVSLNCGLLLLLFLRPSQAESHANTARAAIVFIVAGMLMALLSEFAVAPRIVARENLALWHRVGSGLYLLQWLCAGAAFWRLAASSRRAQV
ncbi:DUF4149 domain-containing protein [Curvibacter delicatus]|jgi:hypothetical protein|uniref:DUF4149 domain-containing protein n=1 Tax=Curvibacter delicatus TaxID=80879 RepID=UPI000B27AD86|nr:DUF4149 domain-containing protein [Curvibacter delicatus]